MRAAWQWTVATVLVACGGSTSGDTVRVTVPQGAPFTAVAESLAQHDVIGSPSLFRTYAILTRKDRSVRAGVYEFREGMSYGDAIAVLVRGRPAMDRLILPEGLMATEIATAVENQLGIPADTFLAATRHAALADSVGAREQTLEGYLYPSTYLVRVGADAHEIVRQMVAEFEDQWRPEWNARLEELGMSRDEIVTLASIIEGEARHSGDRPYVSSVYHNRLDRGMRLQADPTVIYALGRRRRLFERDYELSSRYNTYRIDGLPPHPIGQPSAASIEAALYPRRTNFLYFVAGEDGKHVFSRTYSDHLATIRAIRGR
jgi:UPF0755 protein